MFNLIFDISHEWHRLNFRPGSLSFKQSIVFQFKLLVNFFALVFIFTLPFLLLILLAFILDS